MCLHYRMQGEDIIEYTNAKCHSYALKWTCRPLCNVGIHLITLFNVLKHIPYINKWISITNIHHIWSTPFWTSPNVSDAQITQTLKFRYGRFVENYCKHKIPNNNNPPYCNLDCLKQNHTCLHILYCCTNKHVNNLHTYKQTQQSSLSISQYTSCPPPHTCWIS